ncbi:hypothetical protein BEWA_046780 [Theileria equi strain WA]|uniref:Uncharacterized protein n=1 Tax=Theileria equi strain WA TaxID=1537102 RepID=L1LAD1_THEEQ|nr:hypothetical protein BEWA_046780 [Theileria equi strain WA]EKX72214.1 hypothetical protein BEWA_046780 [Theileria equi strain WA]|eukprot:XP_004831666.1 hypothetical protein BEWA_046780 [Theileria equi strain WA]
MAKKRKASANLAVNGASQAKKKQKVEETSGKLLIEWLEAETLLLKRLLYRGFGRSYSIESWRMSGELTLNVNGKCGDKGQCNCLGKDGIPGLKAKKETNQPVNGFIKVTHNVKNGGTFTLSGTLNNGNQIRGKGRTTVGGPIHGVEEVSVYYWVGNDREPILLGITTGGDSGKPTYYSYTKQSFINGVLYKNFWSHAGNDASKGLVQLLDLRNCQRNSAVVFNIQDPRHGSFTDYSTSYCKRVTGNITESTLGQSPNPPGSDYVTKTYTIKGGNTKISRVSYKNQPIGIPTISEVINVITLYSYPSAVNVPLMIEFKPPNGNSRWFESQDTSGANWTGYGNDNNGFYDKNNSQLTAKLSEHLDEVLCSRHNNVTLDLSYSKSTSKRSYCCTQHKDEKKISVQDVSISCVQHGHGSSSITAHKHTINDGKFGVAGIYYNGGNGSRKRRNIKLHGSPFPISGIQSVYTFYCNLENPVLIYVESDGMAKGWYKKGTGNDPWTWKGGIHKSITTTELQNGMDCIKLQKLRKYLKDCGCNGLQECPESSNKVTDEKLEKELKEEAEKAEKERNEEIRKREGGKTPVPTPSVSPGSESSGSSSGVYGSSSSDSDISLPQKGEIAPPPPSNGAHRPNGDSVDKAAGAGVNLGPWKAAGGALGKVVSPVIDGSVIATGLGLYAADEIIGKVVKLAVETLGDSRAASEVTEANSGAPGGGKSAATPKDTLSGVGAESNAPPEGPTGKDVDSVSPGQETGAPPATTQAETTIAGTITNSSTELGSIPAYSDPESPLTQSTAATESRAKEGHPQTARLEASSVAETSQTNSSDWKVIFGGSASATVVSGSLTGFGWWVFKRSKGDPWVLLLMLPPQAHNHLSTLWLAACILSFWPCVHLPTFNIFTQIYRTEISTDSRHTSSLWTQLCVI